MNNEAYLKLFFIETYNDENMYYEYLIGKVKIDYDLYTKWHKEMEQKNSTFFKSMKSFERTNYKDDLVESCLSDELCITKYFVNKKERHISEFGKFKIVKHPLGNASHHYICNGYFTDTLEQIYKVLENGSFTVGICGEKKSEIYKDIVKHYGELRSFLLKNGYSTSAIQTNCGEKNRVYLLMYDHKPKKKGIKW